MAIEDAPVRDGAIDFLDLKIGQRSTYLRGEITALKNGKARVDYYRDTLVLEVLPYGEYDTNGQLQEMLFHPEKFMFRETAWGSGVGGDFSTIYPIEQVEDGVLIPERSSSALFFFYNDDKITFLPKKPEEPFRLVQSGCDLLFENTDSLFEGDLIGLVDEFQIEKFHFTADPSKESVSIQWREKAAIACRPIDIGGNGYLVYDRYQLYLSYDYATAIFPGGGVAQSGIGFILADLVLVE